MSEKITKEQIAMHNPKTIWEIVPDKTFHDEFIERILDIKIPNFISSLERYKVYCEVNAKLTAFYAEALFNELND